MYATTSDAQLQRARDAFGKRYSIKVTFQRVSGSEIAARLDPEIKSGNVQTDVAISADPLLLKQYRDQGALAALKYLDPSLPAEVKTLTNGYWTPFSGAVAGVSWNTDLLKSPPKSWRDLLKPELKGKVGMGDPKASIVNFVWMNVARDKLGDDFIRQLRQQVVIYNTSALPQQAVAAGEMAVAVPAWYVFYSPIKAKGAPVGYTTDLEFTTGSEVYSAVIKGSKHPNAAQLFTNWLLTPEGQQAMNGDNFGLTPLKTKIEGVVNVPANYVPPDYERAQRERDFDLKLFGMS